MEGMSTAPCKRKTAKDIIDFCGRLALPPGYTLTACETGEAVVLSLNLETKDAEGVLPKITITLARRIWVQSCWENEYLLMCVRSQLLDLFKHEIDEWLRLDGVHAKEPHPELVKK